MATTFAAEILHVAYHALVTISQRDDIILNLFLIEAVMAT
jgi:hypothetical protein